MTSDIVDKIREYLSCGGLFNPELMPADKVRDMVIECRNTIESLRSQLAEADALLREAVAWFSDPSSEDPDVFDRIDAYLSNNG